MDLFMALVNIKFTLFVYILVSYILYNPTGSDSVKLTSENLDQTLVSNELVFINFYADWCRFSNILMPTFEEATNKLVEQIPESGRVVMAKVDCDKEDAIASRYQITKYPTLKLIRNGLPARKEYRGQRSVDAFVEFLKKELEDPVTEFKTLEALTTLESNKRLIIGGDPTLGALKLVSQTLYRFENT